MSAPRPFSLVRRIIALAIGVSVVTLILHSVSLLVFMKPRGDEATVRLVSHAKTIAAALRATASEQRDAIARAMSTDEIAVSRMVPPATAAAPSPEFRELPPLFEELGAAAGGHVTLEGPGPEGVRLTLAVPLGDETWWIRASSVPPPIRYALAPVVGSVVGIALAAGMALFLGVRLITRPMSKLAEDMRARSAHLRRLEESPRNSLELQGVVRSFNVMVDEVDRAAQSRRDLLAGVSHDLRTPLARLRLRVESECPEATADRMEGDFLAIGRIIDQFLAYAQGQIGVVGEMGSIACQVAQIVGQYRLDGAEVRLLRCEGEHVLVPDLAMQRVMTNLIDNALTHGSGQVEVDLWRQEGEVFVVVYDQGRGISTYDMERAVQPFLRLNDITGAAGHCGLGLAIVVQIAQQLCGRLVHLPFDGRRSGIGIAFPAQT